MGIFKYINLTIRKDIRENLFYIATLVLSVAVVFISFNVIFNSNFITVGTYEYNILSLLGFIILGVLILFMIFANSYYLEDKYKEYGIITLSGGGVWDIFMIISARSIVVSTISILGGCVLGYYLNPLVTKALYNIFNINDSIYFVSREGVIVTAMIILIQCVVTFLLNAGGIYQKKISELMNKKRSSFIPQETNSKGKLYIYGILYLLPYCTLILPVSSEDKVFLMLIFVILSLYGVQGGGRFLIPKVILEMKKRYFSEDKINLIVFSNLHEGIRKSTSLLVVFFISITINIVVLAQYESGTLLNIFATTTLGFIIVIMNFTLLYKFCIEGMERGDSFKQLKLVGYSNKDISKIIKREVVWFYGIFFILILFQLLLNLSNSIMAGVLSIDVGVKIVIAYTAVNLVFSGLSYLSYKKIAL